jgi:SAM-dependent methyltransferase
MDSRVGEHSVPGLISLKQSWGYLPQEGLIKNLLFRVLGHPHPYGRLRARHVLPLIKGSLKTLDLGCGEGVFTRELSRRGVPVTGLDIDPGAVESARSNMKRLGFEYPVICANAESIPFPDGSFEQVISTDVLEHVDHPEQALQQAARALGPGGRLIVTVPTPLYLSQPIVPLNFSPQLAAFGHVHAGWFAEEAALMFERNGFEIAAHSYFGHFPVRLAMEVLYGIAGEKGIRSTRAKLYGVKLSAFLVYLILLPILWLDSLFPRGRRGAFLVICATKQGA